MNQDNVICFKCKGVNFHWPGCPFGTKDSDIEADAEEDICFEDDHHFGWGED